MPTYTYVCTKCGDETEAVQSMSDPPLKRCKVCKGALRRTYHAVGIVLKGSGFHRNDYPTSKSSRSSDGSSDGSSSSDGEKKSDSQSEKKSDTKSEKKSEKSSSDNKTKASSDSD